MVRHHVVFASLQLTLSVLAVAWAGFILLNFLDMRGSLEGFGFLPLQEHATPAIYYWMSANGAYALFAFVASLMIGNRHPDGWAFGAFSWFLLLAANVIFVWHSFFAGTWPIVLPVVAIFFIGQSALLFYRRRPSSSM